MGFINQQTSLGGTLLYLRAAAPEPLGFVPGPDPQRLGQAAPAWEPWNHRMCCLGLEEEKTKHADHAFFWGQPTNLGKKWTFWNMRPFGFSEKLGHF
jgi:hypothetical protein